VLCMWSDIHCCAGCEAYCQYANLQGRSGQVRSVSVGAEQDCVHNVLLQDRWANHSPKQTLTQLKALGECYKTNSCCSCGQLPSWEAVERLCLQSAGVDVNGYRMAVDVRQVLCVEFRKLCDAVKARHAPPSQARLQIFIQIISTR